MGTRMLLKHYLERGVSKAELSRRFGVSRRTIHAWIEAGELDRDLAAGASRYSPRPRRPHKLDPYKGIIDARLAEFPRLSAQRLFDEVRAAGYAGGYSRVRDYVHEVRPRDPAEPAVRFETPPGRQGQVDFGTFTLPWGRRHALLVVLGHSRLLWLRFYPRQTMAVLFDGLESAFARSRCARARFMCAAGTVHTASLQSHSSHVARGTSACRGAVSTPKRIRTVPTPAAGLSTLCPWCRSPSIQEARWAKGGQPQPALKLSWSANDHPGAHEIGCRGGENGGEGGRRGRHL